MPRAPRSCPATGCPNERGKCEKHRPIPWAEKGDTRPETGNRDYRRRVAYVLARDNYRCYQCDDMATEVDHVIPKCYGGADDPHNMAAICIPCHRAKTAREAAEMRRRHRESARHRRPGLHRPMGR